MRIWALPAFLSLLMSLGYQGCGPASKRWEGQAHDSEQLLPLPVLIAYHQQLFGMPACLQIFEARVPLQNVCLPNKMGKQVQVDSMQLQ